MGRSGGQRRGMGKRSNDRVAGNAAHRQNINCEFKSVNTATLSRNRREEEQWRFPLLAEMDK